MYVMLTNRSARLGGRPIWPLRLLAICMLLGDASPATAQRVLTGGLQAGVSASTISHLTPPGLLGVVSRSEAGLIAGVWIDTEVRRNVAFEFEVLFVRKGHRFDGTTLGGVPTPGVPGSH